jgi:hypothetical protein
MSSSDRKLGWLQLISPEPKYCYQSGQTVFSSHNLDLYECIYKNWTAISHHIVLFVNKGSQHLFLIQFLNIFLIKMDYLFKIFFVFAVFVKSFELAASIGKNFARIKKEKNI